MIHLTPTMKKFIVHWGEMGNTWGINRTVAQIHALLHLSPEPLSAEEIADVLMVARSNVSNSLHELQNWGLIKVTHVLGDRKERYVCLKDVCEMFKVVVEERKKREIDPTLSILRECITEIDAGKSDNPHTRKQIMEFLNFFEMMTEWYDKVKVLPVEKVLGLFQIKKRITQALQRGGNK